MKVVMRDVIDNGHAFLDNVVFVEFKPCSFECLVKTSTGNTKRRYLYRNYMLMSIREKEVKNE